MFKLSQFLAALIHVDDTDIYVFNYGFIHALELVTKSQRLLNAWYEALRFTCGDSKLSKFYWTL